MYWYLISYEFRGRFYTISVLEDNIDTAYKFFHERVNQQDNYTLVDIHAATREEMINHIDNMGYLGDMTEFDHVVLLSDSRFKK